MMLVATSACAKTGDASTATKGRPVAASIKFNTPTIDVSTADRALKTRWALQDSAQSYSLRARQATENDANAVAIHDSTARVLTGEARRDLDRPAFMSGLQTFAREILEVKNESESRAVILARIRNATPFTASAPLASYEQKSRDDGETYRYIFERDSTGWKLSQVYGKLYDGADWSARFNSNQSLVPTVVWP
ncbi:MAG TPA: hypothetical protein VGM82_01030 [Gemmatimonadaceae bacterium]